MLTFSTLPRKETTAGEGGNSVQSGDQARPSRVSLNYITLLSAVQYHVANTKRLFLGLQ